MECRWYDAVAAAFATRLPADFGGRGGHSFQHIYVSDFLLPLSTAVVVIWVFCISLGLFIACGLSHFARLDLYMMVLAGYGGRAGIAVVTMDMMEYG